MLKTLPKEIRKDFTLQKQPLTEISKISAFKNFVDKMTSIEAMMITLHLNICFYAAITLKATIQRLDWRFSRKMSVVEFRYNKTIVFGIHSKFTYDCEAYDM